MKTLQGGGSPKQAKLIVPAFFMLMGLAASAMAAMVSSREQTRGLSAIAQDMAIENGESGAVRLLSTPARPGIIAAWAPDGPPNGSVILGIKESVGIAGFTVLGLFSEDGSCVRARLVDGHGFGMQEDRKILDAILDRGEGDWAAARDLPAQLSAQARICLNLIILRLRTEKDFLLRSGKASWKK